MSSPTIKLTLNSKRSRSDGSTKDHLAPPRKKARYAYNSHLIEQQSISPPRDTSPPSPRILPRMSDDETSVSDTDPIKSSLRTQTVLLRATTDAIDNDTISPFDPKKRIPNKPIPQRTAESAWCPLEWFADRIRTDTDDGDTVFDILPFEETEGIAQQLLMYQGGSVTLSHNLITILDTMQRITAHIQSQHDTAERQKSGGKGPYTSTSSRGAVSKTQRAKWLRDQHELLQNFDADALYAESARNKLKIQNALDRYHREKTEYETAEAQRQAIWQCAVSTESTTPPPPSNGKGNYELFVSDLERKRVDRLTTLHRDVSQSPMDPQMSTLSVPSMSMVVGGDIDDSDFMSSADRESDEDFCIGEDDGDSNSLFSHKKRRKKKKKRKSTTSSIPLPSVPEDPNKATATTSGTASKAPSTAVTGYDAVYLEGKNPVYSTTDPARFWSKFKGFIEPIHPEVLRTLFPHLQADAYPVQIPPLPMDKNGTELMLEQHGPGPSGSSVNAPDDPMAGVPEQDRSLYFAEMPVLYESFRAEKSYLDEQRAIENAENITKLQSEALHHNQFPKKSLMGHSFDQRSLSCIVSGAGGMWSFEREDLDANRWDKVGKAADSTASKSNDKKWKSKSKGKSNQKMNGNLSKKQEGVCNEKNGGGTVGGGSNNPGDTATHSNGIGVGYDDNREHKGHPDGDEEDDDDDDDGNDDDNMIEPIVRYRPMEMRAEVITFEESIRRQVCRHFFHSDRAQVEEIVAMPWQERQDDECCAVIKSLQDAMQQKCYEDAPNDIETNVEIANEIIGIVEDQRERNLDDFETLRQFDEHLSVIRKEHIRSGLRVNLELLKDPQWKQYFEQKLNLNVEKAIGVLVRHPHVQTMQK